jgi:GTP-binding protein LepA
MSLNKIRNFSIIAHIDHGKSTLADRILEITHTVESRKMKDQVLDSMELERERGITIKMQPVRMEFSSNSSGKSSANYSANSLDKSKGGEKYILNLIDTPGHIDFYYEVSRALKAVEGCILLVDATQGVQAQTLTTLGMARESGLTIIPVISKIDSPLARVAEVKKEVAVLLGCKESDVLGCSGRTGEGVQELLEEVIKRIPPPKELYPALGNVDTFRGLVFDFQYSNHKGVIVYVRVMDGKVSKNTSLIFQAANEKFIALEVGVFSPEDTPKESIGAGEIGYIVTGIKQPGIASVGDTITLLKNPLPALEGYMTPKPVVWASVYPESQDDFTLLKQALGKLRLSDSSFTHEEESSGTLGRGFRCGFLGMLHLEIITERLHREFQLELVVTTPSITYEVTDKRGKTKMVYSPSLFPAFGEVESVREPWVTLTIITHADYLGSIMQILFEHEAIVGNSENFGDNRNSLTVEMPLRELMRNFFDKIKSASSGFASLSYQIAELRHADVVRLDLLVADEIVPAFTRIVSRKRVQEEAEAAVDKLYKALPRQMFTTKIQGQALGRILSSQTLSAMKKDVTGYLYGGDITRKRKLWEKQKEGKKKMKERGKVNISQEVFLKMMRS